MKMKQKLFTMIMSASIACTQAHADGTPKIRFDQTTYDFGTTSLVQSVTGTFTFQNVGDAELQVQTPKPSCGCTVAGVKPDRLKPGEKGELVFTLNLAGVRGPMEKSITVPSNDPQQPELNLAIKGNVKQAFEIAPPLVKLGELHMGASTNAIVTVKRVDGKKLAITKLETGDPSVRARVEPGKDGEEAARLLIDVRAEGAPRLVSRSVQGITDDSGGATAFSIPVSARFVGDVVVNPEQLIWYVPQTADSASPQNLDWRTRTVSVSATRPDQKLELLSAKSDLKEVAVELVPVEGGKSYNLVLNLAELPKEPLAGDIHLETNLPNQPKLVVPVIIKMWKW